MRTDTDEARDPSLEHPSHAFGTRDVCHETYDTALFLRAHDPCLYNINGGTNSRCDKAEDPTKLVRMNANANIDARVDRVDQAR